MSAVVGSKAYIRIVDVIKHCHHQRMEGSIGIELNYSGDYILGYVSVKETQYTVCVYT